MQKTLSLMTCVAWALSAVILLACIPASAQISESVTTTETQVPSDSPAPPAERVSPYDGPSSHGGNAPSIPMASGGIGDDELAHIKSIESQYNLRLLFTEGNGMYLANVHVQVFDKEGKNILTTVATGPILLLTLPKGGYKIIASESGETHEQKVNVSGKVLARAAIRFRTEDTLKSD